MNEPTTFQGLNEALKRRYGISGDGPVSTFASDAFPTIPVDWDNLDADLNYLAGFKLCGARTGLGPPAGEIGAHGIRNPTTSGVIAVVDGIMFSGAATGYVTYYLEVGNATTPDATASVVLLDGRWGTDRSGCQGVIDSRVGGIGAVLGSTRQFGEHSVLINEPFSLPVGNIVLSPGSTLWVEFNQLATNSFSTWRFRERTIQTWER